LGIFRTSSKGIPALEAKETTKRFMRLLHKSPANFIPVHLAMVRMTDFDFNAVKKKY